MADISNVINVSILTGGRLAARDNLNVVSIMTSEVGHLSTANRFAYYRNAASVASDFGSASQANDFAQAFFGASPNPVNAGGLLVMGFWRAVDESVPALAAVLRGAEVSEAVAIGQLQGISDGSFDIDVDGATVNATALDFRAVTDLDGVVSLLDTAITGATVTLDGIGIVVTSDTTGVASTLTKPVEAVGGTFVGNILGLADGTGATLAQGSAAAVLSAEGKEDALNAVLAETNAYGYTFIDQPTAIEAKSLAEWAQANERLVYDVFADTDNLEIDVTNVVWDIKLSSLSNYRMLYSAANNRKLAAAYMSRAHTVNFNGENSALTMHLKELPVSAEDYNETDISKAKSVGLDIYTTIKQTPVLLTSGSNDFMDNRYNLIGFKDAVETDLFNLLKGTATKIPQTNRGVSQLVDQAEKTTRGFVRAGVFGAGTWSSPDRFGDLDTFNRAIEQNGFYWLAGSLAEQPQADREARKSPVIQGAVKMAGAIHSSDVTVNVNF